MIDSGVVDEKAEAVIAWRFKSLLDAGYDIDDAAALADSPDVDLHQAVELLEHGCDPVTALRILL